MGYGPKTVEAEGLTGIEIPVIGLVGCYYRKYKEGVPAGFLTLVALLSGVSGEATCATIDSLKARGLLAVDGEDRLTLTRAAWKKWGFIEAKRRRWHLGREGHYEPR